MSSQTFSLDFLTIPDTLRIHGNFNLFPSSDSLSNIKCELKTLIEKIRLPRTGNREIRNSEESKFNASCMQLSDFF